MALSYLVITEKKALMPYCQAYSVQGISEILSKFIHPYKEMCNYLLLLI